MIEIPQGFTVSRIEPHASGVSIVAVNDSGKIWRVALSASADVSSLPKDVAEQIQQLITPEMLQASAERFDLQPQTTSETYIDAVHELIEHTARELRYSDSRSLVGYATSTVKEWRDEAQKFVSWRDQVWAHAYSELSKIESGERLYETVEAFILEFPKMDAL